MNGLDEIEDLKVRGSGRSASADVARLYDQAFQDFGPQYLWSRLPSPRPTFTQALAIAQTLRREGNVPAALSRFGSNRRAVPLSEFQSRILILLSQHRNPESYVAGATALNRDGPGYSSDIDIFHDREESVAIAAAEDAVSLADEGHAVTWLRREPGFHAAVVQRHDPPRRPASPNDWDARS